MQQDNPELSAEIGVEIIGVNYTDLDSAKKVLEDNNIHTILSALSLQSQEQSDAQIGLIRAAAASSTVKRFAPSEFGIPYGDKCVPLSWPFMGLCRIFQLISSFLRGQAYSGLSTRSI